VLEAASFRVPLFEIKDVFFESQVGRVCFVLLNVEVLDRVKRHRLKQVYPPHKEVSVAEEPSTEHVRILVTSLVSVFRLSLWGACLIFWRVSRFYLLLRIFLSDDR
jgi:hypothetical protein